MDFNVLLVLISSISIPSLVAGLAFATTVFLVGGFGYRFVDETPALKRRLQAIKAGAAPHDHKEHHEGAFLVRWAEPVGKLVLPVKDWQTSHSRRRLVLAGYRSSTSVYVLATAKLAMVFLLPIISAAVCMLFAFNPLTELTGIALLLIAAVIGFYTPDFFLLLRAQERQLNIKNDFPDAVDLLVVCVEAGLGLDAAIRRVGKELEFSHPDIGEELGLVSLEIKAGKTKADALRALAERTNIQEIKSLSSILIQAEHFGTSIADSLTSHADEMRNIRIQTARERAAKLPVKMAFPVMFCIFPALFLILLGPALIMMIDGFSAAF